VVGRTDPERLPAKLPRATRTRAAIEENEFVVGVKSEASQIVRDRQSCLTCADHDD
jgi:hypothetical protein